MGDINDKETNAILKIITFVKPYMASRDTYHQFSQQVPFLFMTNQVLHSLGYLNRVVKFTPVIKPTSLHALWVDPTTLYSLFCAQKLERKMVLYNFEGNIIRVASITCQKDAIFSSFFDINRLKTPKNKPQEQQRPVAQTSSGSDDKGDRGHAVVSPFKGHLRFGGHWKELCHSRYTPTLITNEHNSSQTCLWCFSKLSHPYTALDGQVKMTNRSFICLNAACPQKYVVMSRDRLSALAIGLAGAAQLMLGYTFPCFDPKNTTEKQAMFSHLALVFSNRKQQTSSPSVGGNTTVAPAP
ncbi:hypothetical protein [Parasitella parasitica]|uniref:Uncharacterized protein n=1 Tax=Parasitella parasitica TaxID=35722 RepID=A0A0B7NGJ8_9FUNG|nr:hypothetical protein [Parasitella parasitica]